MLSISFSFAIVISIILLSSFLYVVISIYQILEYFAKIRRISAKRNNSVTNKTGKMYNSVIITHNMASESKDGLLDKVIEGGIITL